MALPKIDPQQSLDSVVTAEAEIIVSVEHSNVKIGHLPCIWEVPKRVNSARFCNQINVSPYQNWHFTNFSVLRGKEDDDDDNNNNSITAIFYTDLGRILVFKDCIFVHDDST